MELSKIGSGKVRDLYALDDQRLLMVASDRISAYDVVLSDLIPDKGRVLTGLSLFFFDLLETPNHLLSTYLAKSSGTLDDLDLGWLAGRSMIVRRLSHTGRVRGPGDTSTDPRGASIKSGGGPDHRAPRPGPAHGHKLDEPIFTPSTKATTGHDENLDEAGPDA